MEAKSDAKTTITMATLKRACVDRLVMMIDEEGIAVVRSMILRVP